MGSLPLIAVVSLVALCIVRAERLRGARNHLQLRTIGNITIIVVDTRSTDSKSELSLGNSSNPVYAVNVGAGQPWEGNPTKQKLLLEALHAMTNKEEIVILGDSDILHVGCSPEELMMRYRNAISGTTATVVVSAELGAYPTKEGYSSQSMTLLRKQALKKANVPTDWEVSLVSDKECHEGVGQCSSPPAYQYLNYGWFMGPVKDLIDFVDYVNMKPEDLDQARAADYFLQHPDKITLDYLGTLSFSLHNFGAMDNIFSAVQTLDGKKALRNNVTSQIQCFVHGNGNGKNKIEVVRKMLALPAK